MRSVGIQRALEVFLVIFFLAVVIGSIYYVNNPYIVSQAIGYTGCTINETFGIQCPTCGGTRAISAVFNGELIMALQHNTLIVISVPILLYYGIKVTTLVISGFPLTELRVSKAGLWLWLLFAVLFTIIRNLV